MRLTRKKGPRSLPSSRKAKKVVKWAGKAPSRENLIHSFVYSYIPLSIAETILARAGKTIPEAAYWALYVGGLIYFDNFLRSDRFKRSMWASVGNPTLSKKIAESYEGPQRDLLMQLGKIKIPNMSAKERKQYRAMVSNFLAKNKRKIKELRKKLVSFSEGQYGVEKQLRQRFEGNAIALNILNEFIDGVADIRRRAMLEISRVEQDRALYRDPADLLLRNFAGVMANMLALAESGVDFKMRKEEIASG